MDSNIKIPEIWNEETYNKFICQLLNNSDKKYKDFNSRLIPNTNNIIIGIRIPILRNISRKIYKGDYISFLNLVKQKYMEEILLEGFLIGLIDDEDIAIKYIKNFIPKIDNWCVCDTFCNSLKIVRKDKEKYFNFFTKELNLNKPFAIRTSLMILNAFYIDDNYINRILNFIDTIRSNHYYVKMGIAWLISTCYVKFKRETLEYLNHNNLDNFTYNKAIQKIIESKRVSDEEKNNLRKIKH